QPTIYRGAVAGPLPSTALVRPIHAFVPRHCSATTRNRTCRTLTGQPMLSALELSPHDGTSVPLEPFVKSAESPRRMRCSLKRPVRHLAVRGRPSSLEEPSCDVRDVVHLILGRFRTHRQRQDLSTDRVGVVKVPVAQPEGLVPPNRLRPV